MRLRMVGLSHQTTSVAFRERVALDRDGSIRLLNLLREKADVAEGLVVSTCNRTEVYAVFHGEAATHDALTGMLAEQTGVPHEELNSHVYRRQDEDVVEHLFMVASGLDSMVVGENQILAQVREAYSHSVACRANGPVVNKLLHWSLRIGKQVRTRTGVGEGHVSVAAAACELAQKIYADLSRHSVLLVGAGATGQLVVRHMLDHGVQDLTIANRTLARAQELTGNLAGKPIELDGIWQVLPTTDVLITSTAATEPLISEGLLKKALAGRKTPLFIIDIAVPRDVDPAVDSLDSVFLYDLDALQKVVAENVDRRRAEVHRARAMVAAEVPKFASWHRSQSVTPTIIQLRDQFEQTRVQELEKLRKTLDDEDFDKVERMTRAMVNKLLHHPTVQMKQAARSPEGGTMIRAFRQLLGLDEEPGR